MRLQHVALPKKDELCGRTEYLLYAIACMDETLVQYPYQSREEELLHMILGILKGEPTKKDVGVLPATEENFEITDENTLVTRDVITIHMVLATERGAKYIVTEAGEEIIIASVTGDFHATYSRKEFLLAQIIYSLRGESVAALPTPRSRVEFLMTAIINRIELDLQTKLYSRQEALWGYIYANKILEK